MKNAQSPIWQDLLFLYSLSPDQCLPLVKQTHFWLIDSHTSSGAAEQLVSQSPLAARLSENSSLTVGVLEAGPAAFDEPRINVPGRLGETLFTEYDWQFETTPQPGLNGRTLPWNRGKVLGGSSALNFMMWNRGNQEDYDAWEELGNKGWGWDGILYGSFFLVLIPSYLSSLSKSTVSLFLWSATVCAGDSVFAKNKFSSHWWFKKAIFQESRSCRYN